jgi:hypothetical protein
MSLLKFEPSGPSRHGSKKPFKLILGIGALVGTIALGSTLAASINLNSGAPVEFGQGVTQTVACDDEVTITPYSNFLNDGENSDFYFTSFTVTGISESCNGKIFTIQAYSADGSSPLDLYISDELYDHNDVEIMNDNGSFSFVGGGLLAEAIEDIATGFRVTFTISGTPSSVADASAEDVERITIESIDATCEQGFGCEVGSVGPGGGIVFLTPTSEGNSSGMYFEISPNDASGTYSFCDGNVSLGTGLNIGDGISNTQILNAEDLCNNPTNAVYAANEYSNNGYSDWYLPSYNELKTAKANARASLSNWSSAYLSSSGYSFNGVWFIDFGDIVTCGGGYWPACTNYKAAGGFSIRPIRSFGSVT